MVKILSYITIGICSTAIGISASQIYHWLTHKKELLAPVENGFVRPNDLEFIITDRNTNSLREPTIVYQGQIYDLKLDRDDRVSLVPYRNE